MARAIKWAKDELNDDFPKPINLKKRWRGRRCDASEVEEYIEQCITERDERLEVLRAVVGGERSRAKRR